MYIYRGIGIQNIMDAGPTVNWQRRKVPVDRNKEAQIGVLEPHYKR